jgi:hypothetical protein
MIKMKFDSNKFKQKMEEAKAKAGEKSGSSWKKDIKDNPLFKVDGPGKYHFRAFPYIHNEDYTSDPFLDRYYHMGISGVGTVYCPAKNSNRKEKCAFCDFVWEQMKENKGNKAGLAHWRQFLPQRRIMVPGIVRGREAEGIKFFSISSSDDKLSKNHQKLVDWLADEETQDFLHPVSGLDIDITFEAYDAARSAAMNKATHGLSLIELGRKSKPISEKLEETWEEIEKILPNIDVGGIEGYEKKTSEQVQEAFKLWVKALEKKAAYQNKTAPVRESKDSEGTSFKKGSSKREEPEEEEEIAEEQVDPEDLPPPVEPPPPLDRKARAKALLAKSSLT